MDQEAGLNADITATDTGPATTGEDVYVFPVTFAQQRLLFLNELDPNSTTYLVPWSIRISGAVNAGALERSLNEIVQRHEILRTRYDMVEGHPVQIVAPAKHVPLEFTDLTDTSDPEQEAKSAAARESRTPIDLKRGPMVRTRLLRIADDEYALLITTHHIAFDGWSRRILVNDLATLYEAYCAGRPSQLADLPLQYADYAVWQRNRLQGANLERLLQYWKDHLADAPTTLDLPTDRSRPAVQRFRGSVHAFTFPKALSNDVVRLSRQFEATSFMTLLAAFYALLSRYSGQEDILIGSVIANRNRTEVEGLIGLFANTLPLRTKLDGDPTFKELLARVKETALGAYAHQEIPFERLVEELRPERSMSYNPLFQVTFSLQSASQRSFQLSGLRLQPLGGVEATTAKFDLSFFLLEGTDGFSGRIEYNTDLFELATIERMLSHFLMLIEGALADPEQPVSKLPLLRQKERQQLLIDWNATETDYPRTSCLHELIAQRAHQDPDRIAAQAGSQYISYGELHRRSNQLARYLQKRSVGAEVLVGIMVDRTTDLLVSLLGVMKAGGAYVPLDPIYPKDRISSILEDTGAPVVITDQMLAATLPDAGAERIYVDTDWTAIAKEVSDDLPPANGPDNLVYVLYTSGSTGQPKGVEVEHRSLVNLLCSLQRRPGLTSEDTWLAITTLSFDPAGIELYLPLLTGAKVVLASREEAADPEQLQQILESSNATAMNATPATWSMLLENGWTGSPGLKILCGGEALSPDVANQLLPRCRELWNMYGPTEITVCSSAFRVNGERNQTVPIGRPISNTSTYVLDSHGEPVPIGVPGELYIGGAGLARGYRNRPDLTAERFVPNSFRPSERMYRTGDIVSYLPDGNLQYHGRTDFQVKLRGFRIELGEIETQLASHPSVERAAVIVREDRPGGKRLVAYVVRRRGTELQPKELRAALEQRLPDYMVPSIFIELPSFPMSANGKVDRQSLPTPDWSQLVTREKVTPQDGLELMLVRVWEKVLGVSNISVEDNFFDLGGHSVLAVRLLSEVERVVGRKIPLSSLFRGSTVAALANLLREESESDPEPLVMEFNAGAAGTSPIFAVAAPGVRAIGYAILSRQLPGNQPFFKLQASVPIVQGRPLNWGEVRGLAQQYVAGMRAVQSEGPYYIAAMCGGCQIAEQMILQLESQGQKVALFVIFDTWVLEHAHRKWGWMLFGVQQRLRWLRRVSWHEGLSWAGKAVRNRLRIWSGRSKPSRPWAEAYWPEDFRPPRFHAPVVLFKRPTQPYYYVDDPQLGWGARSEGGVSIYNVDANHHEVLRDPHVQFVSRVLQEQLPGAATNSDSAKYAHPEAATTR